MGVVSKSIAREEASNRQDWDAEHRAAKLDISHPDQAVAATNDLFFKERGDARCGAETTHSSLESSASSNLKHDWKMELLQREATEWRKAESWRGSGGEA